jgi:hypothetical protein
MYALIAELRYQISLSCPFIINVLVELIGIWKPAEEKVERKCPYWQGCLLSFGGRIALTETCLSNVPSFMMSFLEYRK